LSETVKRISEDNEFKAKAAKLYFREQYRDTNDFADQVEFIGKSLFELGKEAGLEYR
jgi:tripartite-type tricarboxylate transporter receptor subunit TctC